MHKRLKELQKALGISIKEFAQKSGISYTTMQSYLLNTRRPSAEKIKQIAKAFNVNSDWLLTGQGSMFIDRKGMPKEFLERVKKDLTRVSPKTINNLSFKDRLGKVLSGNDNLKRVEVIELAGALKQSDEEYLTLAHYMPDIFHKTLKNDKVVTMLRSMGSLSDKEIDEVVDSLSLVLDGYMVKKGKSEK